MTAFSRRLARNINMKSHLFCVYHKWIQSLLQKFHNGVDTSVKIFQLKRKKKGFWKAYTDDKVKKT